MSDFLQLSCSLFQSTSKLHSLYLTSVVNELSCVACWCHIPFQGMHIPFWSFFPRYNNCSPFSQLYKYVEIILFGLVFMEKNTKNKKKRGTFHNLLPHISTLGALQNIFQTDSGSYSAGLQLSFLLFLDIGHVTNNPTTHCMDPVRWNHSYLVFLHFLVKLSEIFFLRYIHTTLTWTLKAMPHCAYMVCTIPIFFLNFLIFFYLIHLNFPFWTSTLDPANTSQQY